MNLSIQVLTVSLVTAGTLFIESAARHYSVLPMLLRFENTLTWMLGEQFCKWSIPKYKLNTRDQSLIHLWLVLSFTHITPRRSMLNDSDYGTAVWNVVKRNTHARDSAPFGCNVVIMKNNLTRKSLLNDDQSYLTLFVNRDGIYSFRLCQL